MAKKNDTVALNKNITSVMSEYRSKAFSKVAKDITLKDLSGKTLCDIAILLFNAGYWNGMLDTANNPDLKEAATEINKQIKEQK